MTRDRQQVSWLAGHSLQPPSQDQSIPVALMVVGSPLTVAGAAAALPVATGAPHSLGQPLRALPIATSHSPRARVKHCSGNSEIALATQLRNRNAGRHFLDPEVSLWLASFDFGR